MHTCHITLTDNGTGKVIRDDESDALVVIYSSGDIIKGSRHISADANTVRGLAETLLVECNEIIELLPKSVRREIKRRAKEELRERKKKAAK